MKLWKRILAVAVVAVAAGVLLYFGIGSNRLASLEVIPDNALISRPTINLWYTDEALGDYLGSVALDFSEEKNVRVIPKLVSGLEYLENINKAFESKARLGIMSILIVNESVDFVTLKNLLDLTDGNLASHTRSLEELGYIQCQKQFIGRRPNTTFSVTQKGREAFAKHLNALEEFLKNQNI